MKGKREGERESAREREAPAAQTVVAGEGWRAVCQRWGGARDVGNDRAVRREGAGATRRAWESSQLAVEVVGTDSLARLGMDLGCLGQARLGMELEPFRARGRRSRSGLQSCRSVDFRRES